MVGRDDALVLVDGATVDANTPSGYREFVFDEAVKAVADITPQCGRYGSSAAESLAETFAQWLTSGRGQKLIGDYRLLDKQLFYPDALPQ